MAILVTGGTGLIGRHVVRMLLERGEPVHLLARNPQESTRMASDQLTVHVGCVEDVESISRAILGCDRVCHMAGFAKAWARDPSTFHRVNVIGTKNVLQCAVESGVSAFVHTSSCAAVRVCADGEADENTFLVPEQFPTEYALSKHIAEVEVMQSVHDGLRAVVVYPTRVYGPGPLNDANGATKAISMYLRNRLPFPRSMLTQVANWALVEDVARGHVLALEKGTAGERYILGGANAVFEGVLDLIDRLSGTRHIRLALPDPLVSAIAGIEEAKASMLGLSPLITRQWLTALRQNTALSCAKAVRELGYCITPLEEGLRLTLQWLMESSGGAMTKP